MQALLAYIYNIYTYVRRGLMIAISGFKTSRKKTIYSGEQELT